MSSGERPIGTAKGKQPKTEALCQPPPPRRWLRKALALKGPQNGRSEKHRLLPKRDETGFLVKKKGSSGTRYGVFSSRRMAVPAVCAARDCQGCASRGRGRGAEGRWAVCGC